MGAVCYKPKRTTLSKEEVLRALTDKHLKQSIFETEGKTDKTEEHSNNLLSFSNFTQQIYIETNGIQLQNNR